MRRGVLGEYCEAGEAAAASPEGVNKDLTQREEPPFGGS